MKILPLLFIPLLLSGCGSDTGAVVEEPNATDTSDQNNGQNNGESSGETDGETGGGEGTSGSENSGDGTDTGGETGGEDTTDSENNTDTSDNSGTTSARYRLTFNATWSAETHALNFPGNPHFSGLVGAVHNEQVVFWEPGQIATDGIEEVAETGAKTLMLAEVDAAIANGYATAAISGGGVSTSPGSASVEFEVSTDYPQITVSTMVAPSPDWFVGVHNLNLMDGNGFVESFTTDLAVYDSGTDSGVNYTSGDIDTSPRDPVSLLSSDPQDAPFIEGLPSVGQFVIERLP